MITQMYLGRADVRARCRSQEPSATSRRRWWIAAVIGAFSLTWCSGQAVAQSQPQDVVDHMKKATVMVWTAHSKQTEGDTKLGSGSGYFLNRTGLCMTNNHVVDPGHGKSSAEKFQLKNALNLLVWTVVVDSGTDGEEVYQADVLYQNEKADQALLQVYSDYETREFLESPNFLRILPGHKLDVGMKSWCYGFPGGDARKGNKDKHPLVAISSGHIFDLPRRADGDIKMIYTDALANAGNSGGPFVDIDGNLVGTLTLGTHTEDRTDTCMLVPGDLTQEVITEVFRRGKIPSGIDLEPFYTHLVGADGYVDVPGIPRRDSVDCVFTEDGGRLCGSAKDATILLPTPLGDLTLPCAQMAYLLPENDELGIILMDGGQRLPFLWEESTIDFKPAGAPAFEQDIAETEAVAFSKSNKLLDPPTGKCVLLGGTRYRLLLSEVSGTVKFETDFGVTLSMELEDIARIATSEDGDQVVHKRDGSRLTGMFSDDKIKAVLSINKAPQNISLADVRSMTVDVVDPSKNRTNRGLAEIFVDATPELREVARIIDTGEVERASQKLSRFTKSSYFNAQPSLRKDQIRLLDGVCKWRNGEWKEGLRQFKKLKRSKDDELKWYAQAVMAVYDRYPSGKFNSKPLHQPEVFKEAGKVVAEEHVRRAVEVLGEREAFKGQGFNLGIDAENRAQFMRVRRRFLEASDELMVAGRLDHPYADDAMIQVWTFEKNTLENEIARLNREIAEKQEELGELDSRAREWKGRELEADIKSLEKNRDATAEWVGDVRTRIYSIGFIINDPDKDIGSYE